MRQLRGGQEFVCVSRLLLCNSVSSLAPEKMVGFRTSQQCDSNEILLAKLNIAHEIIEMVLFVVFFPRVNYILYFTL